MAATSVTGVGQGDSGKYTIKDLAILANAPNIIFSGMVEASEIMSPPSSSNTVVFPYALPGGADNYVIMLTTINAGLAYVSDRDEIEGNFTGFSFITETDGTLMYLVVKVGSKPELE